MKVRTSEEVRAGDAHPKLKGNRGQKASTDATWQKRTKCRKEEGEPCGSSGEVCAGGGGGNGDGEKGGGDVVQERRDASQGEVE